LVQQFDPKWAAPAEMANKPRAWCPSGKITNVFSLAEDFDQDPTLRGSREQ